MYPITMVVEGLSDEGAARSLVRYCGGQPALVLGKSGKSQILNRLPTYNDSAAGSPWFVLLDRDQDHTCAPQAASEWLPNPNTGMCFRIAETELESWLLADHVRAARFLGVSAALIPDEPELIEDPKRFIVDLARRSSRRAVREGLVPRPGARRTVGPTYASDIRDFGEKDWRPGVAARRSPSLARAMERLAETVQQYA